MLTKAKAVPSHDSQTTPALKGILWVVSKSAKSGWPCRGRTYGPLIKSEARGVAQVLDELGNPSSLNGFHPLRHSIELFLPIAFCPHLFLPLTPY